MNTPQPTGFTRRTALSLGAAATASMLLNPTLFAAGPTRRVVVWSEGTAPKNMYPNDINGAIAEGLKSLAGWEVITASIEQPDHGLPADVLNKTDVLMWWGHKLHGKVNDELVARIEKRVKEDGMGFIALHSAHFSKPLKRILGTPCSWGAYKCDSAAKVIVKMPDHPIAKGVKDFELPQIERYGEPYAVPTPEAVVLDGVYTRKDGGTESGRMGLCWTIGKGRVFYFTPGHETYNDFFLPVVRQIMSNAVEWAAPKA